MLSILRRLGPGLFIPALLYNSPELLNGGRKMIQTRLNPIKAIGRRRVVVRHGDDEGRAERSQNGSGSGCPSATGTGFS